ncbi:MAG TPA: hypothetical protein PK812_04310 [Beijerinckiaceae bacterium]|nr:hypothetical protein [Beijerinckiaceae bacterium]
MIASEPDNMRTLGFAVLWFFAGLVITWVATVAAGVAWMTATGFIDRDGGASMGLVFMIGPTLGVLGGLIAAIWSVIRSRSR